MRLLIRVVGLSEVAEDAMFVLNDEGIVEDESEDAILEVPDNWDERKIKAALAGPKEFTGKVLCLSIMVTKEET